MAMLGYETLYKVTYNNHSSDGASCSVFKLTCVFMMCVRARACVHVCWHMHKCDPPYVPYFTVVSKDLLCVATFNTYQPLIVQSSPSGWVLTIPISISNCRRKWLAIVDLQRPEASSSRKKLLRESKWDSNCVQWNPHKTSAGLLVAVVGQEEKSAFECFNWKICRRWKGLKEMTIGGLRLWF